MATKLSIALDASQYEQQLAKVVDATRKAAEEMAAAGNTPQTVKMTVDTTEAEQALSNLSEKPLSVTADAEQAISVMGEIPQIKDQNFTVAADTEQAIAVIGEIPQAKDQNITVTADTSQAEQALSDLSDQAEQSTSQVGLMGRLMKSGIFAGMAGQIKAGAAAIGALGAAAGVSVPPVGALAAVINLLTAPLALVAAGIAALAAVGSHVWDKLTISAEEYAESARQSAEAAQRDLEKMKELDSATGSYLGRLRELSSADQQGNAAKAETAQLLDVLQSRYGDLGAEIDTATGKIKNMAEVEERLNAKRRQQAASKHRAASDAAMEEAKAAYMKTGSGWFDGKTEAAAGKGFDQLRQSMSPDQMLKIFESKAKKATSLNDKKIYGEVADKLRKAAEEREKARNILSTGQESGIAAEQASAKKASAATSAKQARDDAARQFAERKSDDEFAQEKDIDKKKANRQARIDAEKKNEAQYQKELDTARDTLARIQKDKDKPGYDAGAEADAAKAVADAERKVQESKAKQYGFSQQIQQLDKQRNEEAKKMTDQAAFELEYNRLIAAGEYDKAAALKLEHELKQKNLKLTEAEKQAILDNQKAQKALNLQISQRDKAQDLKWQMMDKAGLGKEASEQRALRDAEKVKGRKLTDSEIETTKRLHELTWNMDNMREPQFGDLSIKTNSLTSRGGFQTGAVVPDADKYNRQIAQANQSILQSITRIESMFRDLGKF